MAEATFSPIGLMCGGAGSGIHFLGHYSGRSASSGYSPITVKKAIFALVYIRAYSSNYTEEVVYGFIMAPSGVLATEKSGYNIPYGTVKFLSDTSIGVYGNYNIGAGNTTCSAEIDVFGET